MFRESTWIIGLNGSEKITHTSLLGSNEGENMVRGGRVYSDRTGVKKDPLWLGRSNYIRKMCRFICAYKPHNQRTIAQSLVGVHSTWMHLWSRGHVSPALDTAEGTVTIHKTCEPRFRSTLDLLPPRRTTDGGLVALHHGRSAGEC